MKRFVAIVIVLLTGCASKTAIYGSTALDVGTTRIAIHRGSVEGNPALAFIGEPTAIVLEFTVAWLITRYADRLKKAGYVHWRTPMRIWSGVHFSVAAWNFRTLAVEKRNRK